MNNSDIERNLEALLFYLGRSMHAQELADILGVDLDTIRNCLGELVKSLSARGINLIQNGDEWEMRTCPASADIIKKVAKAEIEKPLSQAALETLAIVCYNDGVRKSQVDRIRGVNCTTILRNLEVRGLIERQETDNGIGVYKPTIDLYSFLGIASKNELPNFEDISRELSKEDEKSSQTQSNNELE